MNIDMSREGSAGVAPPCRHSTPLRPPCSGHFGISWIERVDDFGVNPARGHMRSESCGIAVG
jgi:hypothetical protein